MSSKTWSRGGNDGTSEPIRVLLVDESDAMRRGLRMRLSLETDIAVVGEASAREGALAALETLKPDVVVMDLCREKLEGCDVAKRMRSIHPAVEIVILTLYGNAEKRRAAADAGACTLEEKGGNGASLVEAIRNAVHHRAASVEPVHDSASQGRDK